LRLRARNNATSGSPRFGEREAASGGFRKRSFSQAVVFRHFGLSGVETPGKLTG
jgi:hypothetical protein